MTTRARFIAAATLVGLTWATAVRAQSPTVPTTCPAVTIEGSQWRTIDSKAAGKTFGLQVLLPASFGRDASKKYPLLVVLDGQWDFKLLASVQGGLFYDKAVPEMVIVGITYSGEHPDYDTLRVVDLTPVATGDHPGSGGGPKFLTFIESELLPMLDREYRIDDSKRVLLGNSLGGLFTVYAMFTRPGLFSDYVASSPAVTYADDALFATERSFATSGQRLPGHLFIGVGEKEGLTGPVERFIGVMRDGHYPGLQFASLVAAEEGHAGNKPEVYNRGLRYVFGGKP